MSSETCANCGRPKPEHKTEEWNEHRRQSLAVDVIVTHGGYGCDTGCCGHYTILRGPNEEALAEEFDFGHPYDEPSESYIRSLAGAWAQKYGVPINFADSDVGHD